MTLVGIIAIAIGCGVAYYGFDQNNSWSAQIVSVLGSGKTNPGTTYIVVGIVIAVIGLTLLVKGLGKRGE